MSDECSDSESCPSFLTESESEHESNYGEEKEQKEVDYTATAKDIICENVNITTENALKLNSGFHNMLKVLKNKLEILLAQCQDRQVEIGKQIEEYKGHKKPLIGKSKTSGYICGQPYFKDDDLYPGPHNEDYLHRKNVLKEFFPLDLFESTDSNWTVKDKVNILKGVKLQIIEFIERENRLKIKKLGNGLEAERLRMETESLKKSDISDLWDKVNRFSREYPGQKFEIDWLRISNVEINGRHSVFACIGLWNNYMLPGLIRDAWRAEEEAILLNAVEKNNHQDWTEIAAQVPGRSPYQCFVHFQTTFSQLAQIKRERWTPEEDAQLIKIVDENRIGKNIVWNKVVENMPLRNKIQCYNRYMFTLMRPTKNTKFTPEEDCIILAYVQQYGDDFRFVPPNLLPGRSNRQVWARYNHTLKYVNKSSGWNIEEDMRLMNFIKENLTEEGPRKISWSACSKALGNHSRLSCRTRYYTIEKFLEKHPDATLDDVPRKGKKLSSNVTDENWMKTYINIRNQSNDSHNAEKDKHSTAKPAQTEKKRKSKQKPKNTEKKPNRIFANTIRCAFKKRLYDKFKYCFHYRFGDHLHPAIDNTKVYCLNQAIFHLLNCTTNLEYINSHMDNFTPKEQIFLRNSLSIRFNPVLKVYLQNAMYCLLFPPNYNTMLGLRGIVLNITYPTESSVKNKKVKNQSELATLNKESYQNALETFRNRFRTMFFWTILLFRQNPTEASFINADEMPKQEEGLPNSLEEQQFAMEQLSKLCQSKGQSKEGNHCQRSEPNDATMPLTPVLPNPPELPNSEQMISDANMQIISIQRINSNESLQHQVCSNSNDSVSTTVAQCAPPVFSVPTIAQHFALPCQSEYSQTPEQVQMFKPSEPIHEQPIALEVNNISHTMEFITQITIINPEDLPVVQVPSELNTLSRASSPVLMSDEINVQSHYGHQNKDIVDGTAHGCPEQDNFKCDEKLDITEKAERAMQEHVENHLEEIDRPSLELIGVVAGHEDHTITQHEVFSQGDNAKESLCALPPENCAILNNENKETVMDLSQLNSDIDESSNTPTADYMGSSDVSDAECTGEKPNSSTTTQITSVTSVGDFVIQELQETDSRNANCPLDLSEQTRDNVPGAPCDENNSSSSLDESNWNPTIYETPRKTYSRSTVSISKSGDEVTTAEIPSHAWRWVHIDESNLEDVELHENFWRECDPVKMRYQAIQSNTVDTKTGPADEIIVIDDDEVEIKDEPVDSVPRVENVVDESCIQQIIKTASNILQLSETFKIRNSLNDESEQPSNSVDSEEYPVLIEPYSDVQSGSLIVQTPSRVFDESSNCYYYVDEIEDIPSSMEETNAGLDPSPLSYWQFRHENHRSEMSNANTLQNDKTTELMTTMQDHQTPTKSASHHPPKPGTTQNGNNKRVSKSDKVENLVIRQGSSTGKIQKPKRPPRSPTSANPSQQRYIQNRALSLLDALFKQPRLTPSRQRPPSRFSSAASPCYSNSQAGQQLLTEQPLKKLKLEAEESQSEECNDEQFDAIDVISMLANVRTDAEKDDVDEEESAFLAQLSATHDEPAEELSPIICRGKNRRLSSIGRTKRRRQDN